MSGVECVLCCFRPPGLGPVPRRQHPLESLCGQFQDAVNELGDLLSKSPSGHRYQDLDAEVLGDP